jgi:hypothetical protein
VADFQRGTVGHLHGPTKKLSIKTAVNSNIGEPIANSISEVPQAQNALECFLSNANELFLYYS